MSPVTQTVQGLGSRSEDEALVVAARPRHEIEYPGPKAVLNALKACFGWIICLANRRDTRDGSNAVDEKGREGVR